MKTGILTDPYGNPIVGSSGLTAPTIDSNHIYVYDCSESSGTTLSNTGSGSNGTLTFNGAENTDYTLGERFLGRSIKGFRNLNYSGTGGATSGTSCSITGSNISIEAFIMIDYYSSTQDAGYIVCADAGSADFISLDLYFGNIRLQVATTGHTTAQAYFTTNNILNSPLHILGTYVQSTGALKVYCNGLQTASATALGAYTLPTLTRVSVGDLSYSSGTSFKGYISQARFSNITRSASYALTTAENLLGM